MKSSVEWAFYGCFSIIKFAKISFKVVKIIDLEQLWCITCDVMKLCTKFERSRAIHSWVIAMSVFDLSVTLNIALRVALCSGMIFTKFHLRQLLRAWIIAFFYAKRYVTLWPWPLTCWPWKFMYHQVLRDQSLYVAHSTEKLHMAIFPVVSRGGRTAPGDKFTKNSGETRSDR